MMFAKRPDGYLMYTEGRQNHHNVFWNKVERITQRWLLLVLGILIGMLIQSMWLVAHAQTDYQGLRDYAIEYANRVK